MYVLNFVYRREELRILGDTKFTKNMSMNI